MLKLKENIFGTESIGTAKLNKLEKVKDELCFRVNTSNCFILVPLLRLCLK